MFKQPTTKSAYIGIACLAFVTIFFFAFNVRNARQQKNETYGVPANVTRPAVYVESPARGSERAFVTVFEFADFACPACRVVAPVLAQLAQKYPDIRIVWKDFPIHGTLAAIAARCAHAQGYFWQYHDWLFTRQNSADAEYLEGAALFPIQQEAFAECMDEGAYANAINRDFYEGKVLGITQTPTIVIGEIALEGVITFEELERALLQAMAR